MISQTKQNVRRVQRKRRRQELRTSWRQIKCFWTWPFGHAYVAGQCVDCRRHYEWNL